MSTTTTIHKLIKTRGAPITSPASPTFPPPGFQAAGSKWRRGARRWFTSAAVLLALMLSATGASAQNNPATGVPTINGDPIRGALLASNITALEAADLAFTPFYTYQWNRHSGGVDTAISGATFPTYILTQDDVGQRITVTVSFTNHSLEPDSRTSVPTATITAEPPDTPPTANAGADQTVAEGASVTLNGSGNDPDGDNSALTYAWTQTDGQRVTLTGDTTATPTFTAPANLSANAVLVFSLVVNDGTNDSAAATVTITVTNDAPTGAITINGTPVRGELLAANITALEAAGLAVAPFYTYQWNRHSGGVDTAINDATGQTYTPTQDDVGQRITVTVSFTNHSLESESLTSVPTAPVADINTPPTGVPTISGTLIEGRELTVDASGISDANGPETLSFTYQWNRRSGRTDRAIGGATNRTYTLTQGDVGEMITVTVRYTDANNTNESLTSTPTSAITANMPPTANAGSNQRASKGTEVTLDGRGSDDPDGNNSDLTYLWSQDAGATVTLSDTTAPQPRFTIPTVIPSSVPASYTFSLVVSDGQASSTNEATVRIFIRPLFRASIANQTYTAGNAITALTLPTALSGPRSVPSTNTYTLAPLPAGLAFDSASRILSGTPTSAGTFNLTYTATNEDGDTDSLAFTITAAANNAPTSSGLAVSIEEDTAHSFGLGEFNFADADGDDLHSLRIDTLPATGSLTLDGAAVTAGQVIGVGDIGTLVFTPVADANGDVTFTYSVSDGIDFSATATATVTVTPVNDPPTANAGLNQRWDKGTEVTLDGRGSSDPDGNNSDLTYLWSQDAGATTVTLSDATAPQPRFTIPTVIPTTAPASYTFSLVVSDGQASSTNETTVRIFIRPLFRTSIANQTYSEGNAITALTLPTALSGPGSVPSTNTYTLTSLPAGLAFDSASRILSGTPTSAGTFNLTYTATNEDGDTDSLSFSIEVITPNVPPTADAGADQTVAEGASVTLNGSGDDPDGDNDALTYAWTQVGTATVTLSGEDTAAPTFTAPADLLTTTSLEFSLTVNDGEDDSQGNTVTITITGVNDPPIANAGADQTVAEGATVTLDGSGSSDSEGENLTYAWTQVGTPMVSLSGENTAAPTFTAPADLLNDATLEFSLVVNDGESDSAAATVTITITGVNDPPIANAGPDQNNIAEGASVTLNGSGSSDSDSDNSALIYAWTQVGTATVTLNGADTATPTFTAPADLLTDATLEFSLVVNDGTNDSAADSVIIAITGENVAPTANAGSDQRWGKGTEVTLDGTGSSDPDGDNLSYLWSQGTSATTVTLSSTTAAQPTFTIPNVIPEGPALYTFILVVNDGALSSTNHGGSSSTNEATVRIFVRPLFRDTIDTQTYSLGSAITDLILPTAQSGPSSLPSTNTYTLAPLPPGLTFDAASRILSGTPTSAGTSNLTYTATNGDGHTDSLAFSITINAPTNTPPTGLPAISGTTTQGETLTVDTSGISDADGPASLPFTYQWNRRSGSTDTAIGGATNSTYILTQDDVGQMITVSVRYTDAGNTSEGPLTSVPTAAVANTNDAPTGVPTISGTTTQGETLTADTSGITDVDGPASLPFTYQWNRRSGSTDTAISGATNSTYILTQDDVGETITVTVRYTDAGNTQESLTSQAVSIEAAANTPPTTTGLAVSTNEDTPYTFAAGDFNFNDTDSGDNLVEVRIDSLPASANGSLALSSTAVTAGDMIAAAAIPNLVYTPVTNVNGDATFTFSVSDGTAFSATATATVTVTPVNDAPTLSGTPATTVAQGDAYSFTPGGGDVDVGDTLVYAITNMPPWAEFDTATGALTGTPANEHVGDYADIVISVRDRDTGGLSASLPAFSIEVTNTNDAPTLSGTPATSVAEDSAYSFTPSAEDADGDTLEYAITNMPSWASFSTTTGALTGTPANEHVGTTTDIVISVTDGIIATPVALPAFAITVTNTNDAPTISGTPATTVAEDSAYSFTPTGADDDGDTLTYAITNMPSWASFDTATGALTGTPANEHVGDYADIVISVTDGIITTPVALAAFDLTVTNTNDAPTITGTPATSVAEDSAYSFTPSGEDDDGDTLTFAITNMPSWATFDETSGALTGTPVNADVGNHADIVISVTDGIIATPVALPAFDIAVTNTNDPPTLSGTPATSVAEDSAYSFTPTGEDADGDTLVYAISNIPSWASFSTATGALTGTPANEHVGTTTGIIISVTDNNIATPVALAAFDLTVTNTNDAPTISGTPDTSVTQGAAYSFTPGGGDVDVGDTLVYAISNPPPWAEFDTATGALTGTPDNDDVGTTTGIIITVTDNNIATPVALAAFDLTVTNTNDAPTLSGTPATSVAEDSLYTFTPLGADVDTADMLRYAITNPPDWATFDETSGVLTGTPDNDDVGTTTDIVITVRDRDTGGLSASLPAFSIEVTNVNDAPTISGTPDPSVTQGAAYSFTPTGADVDVGDTLVYAISNPPPWAEFDTATGALTGTPANEHVGTTTGIIISVTDNNIATPVALDAFDIEVTAAPVPPPGPGPAPGPSAPPPGVPDADEAEAQGLEPASTNPAGTAITLPASEEVDVSNASPADFTVTSTLNGVTTDHGVTAIRAGSIILEVTPPIPAGADIEVSYRPALGSITSTATGEELASFMSLSVANTVPAQVAPVANAGEPQTVTEGATVTLNGSATDPDSDAADLSYAWTQTSGPAVTLSGADSPSPSFTAPTGLSADAVLVFSLTVSDGSLSASDSVNVTVTNVNDAPSANAGENQSVDEGATVTLSGSGTDPDTGDSLSYAWSQTSGQDVTLSGADSPSASFTAPTELGVDAVLGFSLTVSDGRLSASASVNVTVTAANDAPSADAGTDQSVDEGATVTLSGSGTDPDPGDTESLSYAWTQTGGPTVSLSRANSASPSFTAPNALDTDTVLTFRLTVTDPRGASGSDSVQVTVETNVAARQQALELNLAAFGRSVAASAVDAIGERLKPASAGPQTSTVSGLSLAACLSSITNLISADTVTANSDSTADNTVSTSTASAHTASANTVSASTAGLGDLGSTGNLGNPGDRMGGMGGLNRTSADRQSDNPVGSACQLPDREQLARSAFVIPLGLNQNLNQNLNESENHSTAEPSAQWSLWGRGDFSHFEGSPQSEFDLDGEVVSGYLGLDYRLETGALVGVALSHSSGETDYRSGETDGELETDLSSVYPYGYWSPRDGLGLWGLLGIGQGDATLSHGATTFETDLDMRLGALGLRQALHSTGEFELALKADAFIVELESEDVPGLPEVTAQARRARLLLEASRHWQVQPEASLSTRLELGVRVDGGDAEEGEGAEVGVGLEYANGRGLSTALRAHGLLAHKESDFEAWGASLTVQLDPGVSGQGLALTLTPVWGQDSGGGAQALWESERALQDSGLAQRPTARLELNLSYGLVQSDRLTRLRPFAQLEMAGGIARRLRLGMQLERPDGLELEVFAGRNASEQRAPEHLLGLSGRLHF